MKVISGGQTGADIAGVKAAKSCAIETSGYMPNGWITLDGPKPEYAIEYNMIEHPIKGYPSRTEGNVKFTDGTIRFAKDFNSPGELCTLKFIKKYNKPYLDINIYELPNPNEVIEWISSNQISKLNIAGNTERTANGIELIVFDFLVKVFKEVV